MIVPTSSLDAKNFPHILYKCFGGIAFGYLCIRLSILLCLASMKSYNNVLWKPCLYHPSAYINISISWRLEIQTYSRISFCCTLGLLTSDKITWFFHCRYYMIVIMMMMNRQVIIIEGHFAIIIVRQVMALL